MNRRRTQWKVLGAMAVVLLWLGGCGQNDEATVTRDIQDPLRFNRGIVLTDAWAGQWQVVTTFRACDDDATIVVEDVVDWICPGDTIRLGLADITTQCTGTSTDDTIEAACEYIFSDAPCRVRVALRLDIKRTGDTIEGSGEWTAAISAECEDRYPIGCETISIRGTRLDAGATECDTLHMTSVIGTARLRSLNAVRSPAH